MASVKVRRPRAEVLPVAEALMEEMRPFVEQVAIAGSLRREKAQVGDIEIVAIAKVPRDLFGDPTRGLRSLDLFLAGRYDMHKDGRKYKSFEYEGVPVDLFLATPQNWGYIFMLRTGSAAFSHRMVTPTFVGGLLPPGVSVRGGTVFVNGRAVEVPTEQELFSLWGLEVVPPPQRS